jgi:hypothetical protein
MSLISEGSLGGLNSLAIIFFSSIAKENIYLTLFLIHFINTFVFDAGVSCYLFTLYISIFAWYVLNPLYFGYDIDDFYEIKDRFLNISYQ